MGFFDGTNKVPARGNSNRFKAGRYPEIRVDKIGVKSGFNGLRFVVEGTVTKPPIQTDPNEAPTPLDAKGSWTCRLDGQWADLGKGDAKAFIAALRGVSRAECETRDMEAELDRAIAPDQPFAGLLVATEAFKTVTKGGQPMTRHVWEIAGSVPAAAPPASAAPAAPPPAPADDGGPWYPIAGDPRGNQYNAAGQFRTV